MSVSPAYSHVSILCVFFVFYASAHTHTYIFRAEERLRTCGVLASGEDISGAVEAVSFNDTLGGLPGVVEEGLSEDRTIPISLVGMYEVIADFKERVRSNRTACVSTKYKTVDWKVRPVRHPCQREGKSR